MFGRRLSKSGSTEVGGGTSGRGTNAEVLDAGGSGPSGINRQRRNTRDTPRGRESSQPQGGIGAEKSQQQQLQQQRQSHDHHDYDDNVYHIGFQREGGDLPRRSSIIDDASRFASAAKQDVSSPISLYRLSGNHPLQPPTPDPASTSFATTYRPNSLPPPPRVPSDSVRRKRADLHRASAAQLFPSSEAQSSAPAPVQVSESISALPERVSPEQEVLAHSKVGENPYLGQHSGVAGVVGRSHPPLAHVKQSSVSSTSRGALTFGSTERASAPYPPSSRKRESASSSIPTASTASRSRPTSHSSATSAFLTSRSSVTSATPRSRTDSLPSGRSASPSPSALSSTPSRSISARVSSIFKRRPRHTAPSVLSIQVVSRKASRVSALSTENDELTHPTHSSGSKSSETATAGPDSPASASTVGKSTFVQRTISRFSPRKPSSLRNQDKGADTRDAPVEPKQRPISVFDPARTTRSVSHSSLGPRRSSVFFVTPSKPSEQSHLSSMTQSISRAEANRAGINGSRTGLTAGGSGFSATPASRGRSSSTAASTAPSTTTASSNTSGSAIAGPSSSRSFGIPRQPSRQSILNHTHAPNATLTVQLSPAQQYQQSTVAGASPVPVLVPFAAEEEVLQSPGVAEAPRFQRRRADSELQTSKEKGKRGLLGKVKDDPISSFSGDEGNTSGASSKPRMSTFASLRKLIRAPSSRRKSTASTGLPAEAAAPVSGRSRAGSSTLPSSSTIPSVPETQASEFGALLPPISPSPQFFPLSPTPQNMMTSPSPQSPQPSSSLRTSDDAPVKRTRSTSRSGVRSPFRARDNPKDVAARRASEEGGALSDKGKGKGRARDQTLSESGPDEADEMPMPTVWGEPQDSRFSSLKSSRGTGVDPPSPPLTPIPTNRGNDVPGPSGSNLAGRNGRDRSLTIQALSANSPISAQRKNSASYLGASSPLLDPQSTMRTNRSDSSGSSDAQKTGVALTTGRSEEDVRQLSKPLERSIPQMWRGSNHDTMPGALHIDDEISDEDPIHVQGHSMPSRYGSSTTTTSFQTATSSPPQQVFTTPLPSKGGVQSQVYSNSTTSVRSPGSPATRFLFPSPSTPMNATAEGSPQTQTGHSGRSLNSFGVPQSSRDPAPSASDVAASLEHRGKHDANSSQEYSIDGTSISAREYLSRPAIAAGPSSARSSSQPSSTGFSPVAVYASGGATTIDKMSMSDTSTSPSTYQRRRNTFGGGELAGDPVWNYDSQISLLQSSQAHMSLRSPDREISVEEIESNVAAVEAALRDHYLAGSFDPSSLRRRLVLSDAHRRRLSHNVEEEDEMTDDAHIPSIPDEITTPERITLAPTSRSALVAAVSQVRKALSSSQLRRDAEGIAGNREAQQREVTSPTQSGDDVNSPPAVQTESTPARAARMRVESMRDVEEAYTRMCSLVTQVAAVNHSPDPASMTEVLQEAMWAQDPPRRSEPAVPPMDSPTLETRGERERARSAVVPPSSQASTLPNKSRFLHRYTQSGSGIVTPSSLSGMMGMSDSRQALAHEPHLRQRSSSSSLDDRQATATRLRLISESNAAAHAAARRAAAVAASKRLSAAKQDPSAKHIDRASVSTSHSRSASGNAGSGNSGTSPSATAKTQGTPRSAGRLSPQQRRSGETKRTSSERQNRPDQALLQQLHEEEDGTTPSQTDAATATTHAAAQGLGHAFEAKPLTLINSEKRRSVGTEETRWSSRSPLHAPAHLRSSTGQAPAAPVLGTYRDSNVPSWREWSNAQGVGSGGAQSLAYHAAMPSPLMSSGQSYAPSTGRSYRHSALYEDSRASQDRSTASPAPTASIQTIMRRHALERDSLLDVLERTRTTASDAQRRNEELEAELHQEVTRVLELQREVTARTQREQSLERRVTQLEQALALQRGENQRLEEAVALSNANAVAATRVRVQSNVPFEMMPAPTSQQGLAPSPRVSMPVSERLVAQGTSQDPETSFISRGDSSGGYPHSPGYTSILGIDGSDDLPKVEQELPDAGFDEPAATNGLETEWALQDEQPPADLQSDTDSERDEDDERRRSYARSRVTSSRLSGTSSRIVPATSRIADDSGSSTRGAHQPRNSIGSPTRVLIANGVTRAKSDTNSVASSSTHSRIPSLSLRQQPHTHTPSGSLGSSIGAGGAGGPPSQIGSPAGSVFGSGRRMPSVLKAAPSRIPTSTSANSRIFSTTTGSSFSESPVGEYVERFDGRSGYWDERRPNNYDPVSFPPHHQARLDMDDSL